MDRLKQFGIWILLVIAFYIFSNGIIYLHMNAEEIGGSIYNITHEPQMTNEIKKS